MRNTQWWAIVVVSTVALIITVINTWIGAYHMSLRADMSPQLKSILTPILAVMLSLWRPLLGTAIFMIGPWNLVGIMSLLLVCLFMAFDLLTNLIAFGTAMTSIDGGNVFAGFILIVLLILIEVISTFGFGVAFTLAGPDAREQQDDLEQIFN